MHSHCHEHCLLQAICLFQVLGRCRCHVKYSGCNCCIWHRLLLPKVDGKVTINGNKQNQRHALVLGSSVRVLCSNPRASPYQKQHRDPY